MAAEPIPSEPQWRQENRLRVLAESAHAFAEATTNVHALLQLVARRCADLVGDGCYIRLIGADGVSLEPVATYHPDPAIERYLNETSDTVPLRVGEGISGRVVESGQPVLIPHLSFDVFKDMTTPGFVPVFQRIGIASLLVVRLRARATNLGFIALVRNGGDRPAYAEEDLQLALDLADRAALAIDNARMLDSLERRVAERTRELQAANHELESFSYSVSHDLRTPLRAIDGFSRVLEEDHAAALDEEGRRLLDVIRRNSQRMGQLIDDLLRFSRPGRHALRLGRVDTRALVDSIVDELRDAEPARALDFRLGDLPPAFGDDQLLRQVWRNLLGNAVKYSRGRTSSVIEVAGALDTHETTFRVTDNGSGFDPRYVGKLFQVFQRLHPATQFEGTGVGLALVQRIVSRHGGRVWADGRPDQGATFGFALPRRQAHD